MLASLCNKFNCSPAVHAVLIAINGILIIIFGAFIITIGVFFNFSSKYKPVIRDLLGLEDTEDPELPSYSEQYNPIFWFVVFVFFGMFVVIFGAMSIMAVSYRQPSLLTTHEVVMCICFVLALIKSIQMSKSTIEFKFTNLAVLVIIAMDIRSAFFFIKDVKRDARHVISMSPSASV
jgi:hypothetical protein